MSSWREVLGLAWRKLRERPRLNVLDSVLLPPLHHGDVVQLLPAGVDTGRPAQPDPLPAGGKASSQPETPLLVHSLPDQVYVSAPL